MFSRRLEGSKPALSPEPVEGSPFFKTRKAERLDCHPFASLRASAFLVARNDRNMKDIHAHGRAAGAWGIAPKVPKAVIARPTQSAEAISRLGAGSAI